MLRRVIPVSSALLLAATGASGQSFTLIEPRNGAVFTEVRGLSADGRVVVGRNNQVNGPASQTVSFTINRDGTREDWGRASDPLPNLRASALSGDGATTVGDYGDLTVNQGSFYRRTSGVVSTIPGIGPFTGAFPTDANYNASVICGYSSEYLGNGQLVTNRALRWSETSGYQYLDVGTTYARSFAWATSANGHLVVGRGEDARGATAFRWTQGVGIAELPGLPGNTYSEAFGVSSDGRFAVGKVAPDLRGWHAVRWDGVAPPIDLGVLSGDHEARARAVSADGSVVVGASIRNLSQFSSVWTGFIWREATGMQSLADLVAQNGLTVPAGWSLREATFVSDDGLTIAGVAEREGFANRGFVISVPAPGAAVVWAGLGAWAAKRRRSR